MGAVGENKLVGPVPSDLVAFAAKGKKLSLHFEVFCCEAWMTEHDCIYYVYTVGSAEIGPRKQK